MTNGITEKDYFIKHPKEIMPDIHVNTKKDFSNTHSKEKNNASIKIEDNSHKYAYIPNPYSKMVNQAIYGREQKMKYSFRAKSFFDKAYELALLPNIAKLDSNNPIFLHMANPHEYRFYQIDK